MSKEKEESTIHKNSSLTNKEKELSDMENEFLKKLDALVQERLKREKKR